MSSQALKLGSVVLLLAVLCGGGYIWLSTAASKSHPASIDTAEQKDEYLAGPRVGAEAVTRGPADQEKGLRNVSGEQLDNPSQGPIFKVVGRVVHGLGVDSGVPGAEVSFATPSGEVVVTTTELDGSFAADMADSPEASEFIFRIFVSAPGYEPTQSQSYSRSSRSGVNYVDVETVVLTAGTGFSGRALDTDGQPVASAWVLATAETGVGSRLSWTDASGRFLVAQNPTGLSRIRISHGVHGACEFWIHADSGQSDIGDVVLEPRSVIQGVVTHRGTPLPGRLVRVSLRDPKELGAEEGAYARFGETETQADGSFRFQGLGPEPYTVRVLDVMAAPGLIIEGVEPSGQMLPMPFYGVVIMPSIDAADRSEVQALPLQLIEKQGEVGSVGADRVSTIWAHGILYGGELPVQIVAKSRDGSIWRSEWLQPRLADPLTGRIEAVLRRDG